jgi:UDP-N-acetyl-D-glucosamine/UDP-N-acetyl-D-galactosamine dehydrogenase
VASEVVKLMLQNDVKVKGAKVLVLGITFKENCPDVRNTKVVDVIKNLKDYGMDITIYDPLANTKEVKLEYGLETVDTLKEEKFDSVVLTVAHKEFLDLNLDMFKNPGAVVYDVKGVLGDKCDRKL